MIFILSTRIKDESLTQKSQALDTNCHHVRLILLRYGTILPMCACRLVLRAARRL